MPQPKKSSSGRSKSARSSRSSAGRGGNGGARTRASREEASDEALRAQLAQLRETLARSVMLPGEVVRDMLEDAVRRGRMTRDDAEELGRRLLTVGRQQTEDLIGELEALLDRGRHAASPRGNLAAAGRAARRAPGADRVMREVDRARRAAGLGPSFPITGYEELTAAQVVERLDDLSAADLRKVRDHERRNANRKTVLSAIERALR